MNEYRKRLMDAPLQTYLRLFGAVLIEGPKWCGKTTTAEQVSKSCIYLAESVNNNTFAELAELDLSIALKGENPRLIDEWQKVPVLWDKIRAISDHADKKGLYILTGSNAIDWNRVNHSGFGRIARMRMRTMSLWESGDSTGAVSLTDLFNGGSVEGTISPHSISDIADILTRGGWPESVKLDPSDAHIILRQNARQLLNVEINRIDGKMRDSRKMELILRSLARNSASRCPDTKILEDICTGRPNCMHINTLRDYLKVLGDLYVTEDLIAWNPRLRSRISVQTSPTRHFSEPALAAFFLGVDTNDLKTDLDTFGLLFESMVVRDLRSYMDCEDGDVYHYHDRNSLEADAILHTSDGKWAGVEIKLNPKRVDEGADNLLRLRDRIDSDMMGEPAFLAVVTATGAAYTRPDGIHVVPIGCLRN